MRLILRACLLALILVQLPARAQNDTTAAEDFFADSPLILTVSRMAKPLLESPASVSVIDRNPKHEISATYYYLDDITWLDASSDIPVARRLDLRYAYQLNNELNIEIIDQNLLEDYQDYEKENIHDQVIYLRLSGGF